MKRRRRPTEAEVATARRLRRENMSVAAISERMGVSRSTVGGWLAGYRPEITIVCKLCREPFVVVPGPGPRPLFCCRRHMAKYHHMRSLEPVLDKARSPDRLRLMTEPQSFAPGDLVAIPVSGFQVPERASHRVLGDDPDNAGYVRIVPIEERWRELPAVKRRLARFPDARPMASRILVGKLVKRP